METPITSLPPVLLVEDDPNDTELTLLALRESHLANPVVAVRDGVDALDYLHRRNAYAATTGPLPAIILLDLKLPKVDGLQVLSDIKADSELRVIPVIMLTSSREEADLLTSYRLGVNAYVVKPVGFQNFLDAIRRLGSFWFVLNEPPPGHAVQAV
jgi:CheY-like chemotaxis protein